MTATSFLNLPPALGCTCCSTCCWFKTIGIDCWSAANCCGRTNWLEEFCCWPTGPTYCLIVVRGGGLATGGRGKGVFWIATGSSSINMLIMSGVQIKSDESPLRLPELEVAGLGADVPPPKRADAGNTFSVLTFFCGGPLLTGLTDRFFCCGCLGAIFWGATVGLFIVRRFLFAQHVVRSLLIRVSISISDKLPSLISL